MVRLFRAGLGETGSAMFTNETGDKLHRTREDLLWYFTSRDAVMGLHAAGLMGGGGECVWDALKIHEAHMAKRTWFHRRDVTRCDRVYQNLIQLEANHRHDIFDAYTPFGSGRTTTFAMNAMRLGTRQLIGLVLKTEALTHAFKHAHKATDLPEVPMDLLLRWLERMVPEVNNALPSTHALRGALLEADRREGEAAAAYDVLRASEEQQRALPNKERLARHMAESKQREDAALDRKLAAQYQREAA